MISSAFERRSLRGLSTMVNRPGVDRGVHRPRPDERRHRQHVGVFAHHLRHGALAVAHGLEGNVLRGVRHADDDSGILLGQQPLGDQHVKPDGPDQRGDGYQQRELLVREHPFQSLFVERRASRQRIFP